MKKLTYIIAAMLLISVPGISGVALAADETATNGAPVSQGITISVPFQDAIDAHKKGVSTDGGDEGDHVKGSGDPLKELNVAREKNKKGISTDGDDDGDHVHGSGDPLKGLNVAREKNKKAVSTDGDDDGDHVHGSGDPLKGLNVTRGKK